MKAIVATVLEGQVTLDAPAEWPDGTRVEVRPLGPAAKAEGYHSVDSLSIRPQLLAALDDADSPGLDEALWPLSHDETQLLLNRMLRNLSA